MQTNPLLAWIAENFKRLTIKSPAFFKVWKVILGIPVLIIALPNALQILNIHLPQVFNAQVQNIVGWATTAAFLMTFLPTQSDVTAVDQNGTPVKQTDTIKLPFTAQAEKKAIQKKENDKDEIVSKVSIPNPVKPV